MAYLGDLHRLRRQPAIAPQLIETTDFRSFRISQLAGPAAQDKGLALFPRPVGGRRLALSRWDRENSAHRHARTTARAGGGGRHRWTARAGRGSCSRPATAARRWRPRPGWLVLTHGVGPMREYAIGALLLDLDDPSRVLGAPARAAARARRTTSATGYVPNVVYSCGALRHGDRLLLPYGASDASVRFALVDAAGAARPADRRRAAADDAGEQLRVVRHHARRA